MSLISLRSMRINQKGVIASIKAEGNSAVASATWDLCPALDKMEGIIRKAAFLTAIYPARLVALKYLEGDKQIIVGGPGG